MRDAIFARTTFSSPPGWLAGRADPSNVVAHMAAGEINEGLDSLPESMAGYNAAAGIAGAEELAGGAQARVLKRQGRLRDEDDQLTHE